MEQAHKSHRPQNIITKCTWHQIQEVLISLTQILSRAVNHGKDRMYVLLFSVANGTCAPWSIIKAELGMDPCSTLLRSRGQCFPVSLIGHMHLVFRCRSCVLAPLWFLRCLPGIHGERLISKFWRSQRCDFGIPSSYKYVVEFSGGCRLSHGDIFVEADMSIQIIAKFTKVESSGDLLMSWWRYSYSYKIFFKVNKQWVYYYIKVSGKTLNTSLLTANKIRGGKYNPSHKSP